MGRFSSLDEALTWIEKLTNFEKGPPSGIREYRLDRMRILFELFGNPHKAVPCVHVAGSKGKGSTAHMIASALIQAGFKTGLYTSPHVLHYRERFLVNGQDLPDSMVLNQIEDIYHSVNEARLPYYESPTTFEILTLLAFLLFYKNGCVINVIETGLGGRLDATNLVDPLCSVITTIEYEHCDLLGNSLAEIAAEKGGIIKSGKPLFTGFLKDEASEVLRKMSIEKGADYTDVARSFSCGNGDVFSLSLAGRVYNFRQSAFLPGRAQKENAALAAAAAFYAMKRLSPGSDPETLAGHIRSGISFTRVPARFETFARDAHIIVIDGAHTRVSIDHTVETFRSLYGTGGVCVFGMIDGKDLNSACATILDCFDTIALARPGTFKKSDIQALYALICLMPAAAGKDIRLLPEALDVFNFVTGRAPAPVLVTGSFYLAGLIKKLCLERGYHHADRKSKEPCSICTG